MGSVASCAGKRRGLELELRQAQKLEAVGRLAAGIAHEINTPTQFVSDSIHFLREAIESLLGLVDKYRVLDRPAMDRIAAAELTAAEQEADLDSATISHHQSFRGRPEHLAVPLSDRSKLLVGDSQLTPWRMCRQPSNARWKV